ncbi:hypothetical protein CK203_107217 [Vitis vinifera]|uniref:Retrotransposon Copia-like N-terminal domain-containing protein n=1 Tax=Vitis vinifera TaxID=29760 RepID=A0A438E252_VITVI|nr:hypothetical protein CK203_107217 [Vitis vinifera]
MANDEVPPMPPVPGKKAVGSNYLGLLLISKSLNGDNYLAWKRAMILALNSKNKLGFVNGSIKAPLEETDLKGYATWSRCNTWFTPGSSILSIQKSWTIAIRGQILLMNPLPSVLQAYSSVSQEEKHCLLTSTNATTEFAASAAMAVCSNNKSLVAWKDKIDRSNTGMMEPTNRPSGSQNFQVNQSF